MENKFCGLAAVLLAASLSGCITVKIPNEEYTMASVAIEYAREVQAVRYAPNLWYEAEQSYKAAQNMYDERLYNQAQKEFIKARVIAEHAENVARLKRLQSGEGFL